MKLAFLMTVSLLEKFLPNLWHPPESSSAAAARRDVPLYQDVKVLTWNLLAPCYTDSLYRYRLHQQQARLQQKKQRDKKMLEFNAGRSLARLG